MGLSNIIPLPMFEGSDRASWGGVVEQPIEKSGIGGSTSFTLGYTHIDLTLGPI